MLKIFLSTPSARRATTSLSHLFLTSTDFYPRPPRGGRHLYALPDRCMRFYFYPRPPRGGRLLATGEEPIGKAFLSTPSARRATPRLRPRSDHLRISIHALREEGDNAPVIFINVLDPFLSTPSARRATEQQAAMGYNSAISIHALREEGDASTPSGAQGTIDFYPRPPRGGRHNFLGGVCSVYPNFYPRPPRGGRQKREHQYPYR